MIHRTGICYPTLVLIGLSAALKASPFPPSLPAEPQAAPVSPAQTLSDYRRLAEEGQKAFQNNEIETAERAWRAALEIAEMLKHPKALANMHNNLGLLYLKQERYPQALPHAEAARKLFDQLQDKSGVVDNLFNIGNAHKHLGNNTEAMRCFQEALGLAQQMQDGQSIGSAYNNIGMVHFAQGSFRRALECYEKALSVPETVDNLASIANAWSNQGLAWDALGLYTQALTAHQKARERYVRLQSVQDIADADNHLGMAYHGLEEYKNSEKCYLSALQSLSRERTPFTVARVLNNLGILYDDTGQTEKALTYFTEALALKRKIGDPTLLMVGLQNHAAILARQKEYPLALSELQEALGLSRQRHAQLETARILQSIGAIYAETGKLDEANATFSEALQLYEAVGAEVPHPSEVGAFQQAYSFHLYTGQATVLALKGKTQEAFHIVERARGNGLARQAAHNGVLLDARAMRPKTYLELKRTLLASHPDTLFLEYASMSNQMTLLFALTSRGCQSFLLPLGEKRLQALADAWREQIIRFESNRGNKQAEEKAAHALYSALLQPVEDAGLLKTPKRLVFVPDGPVLTVPFAALLDPLGKRLIERFPVASALSLSILDWPANLKKPQKTLLAVADPTGKGGDVISRALLGENAPLPLIRKQMVALTQNSPGALGLFGAKARESDVKRRIGSFALLNFGTHGRYTDTSGLTSYLLLAPGEGEDGILKAEEIMGHALSARMAALWACESGLGQRSGGEGLLGLIWAFRAAGCPSVIASQWKVKEEATARLMQEFYTRLKVPGVRKDEALRQAMRAVAKVPAYHSPYYWAGFQVYGETSPVPEELQTMPRRATSSRAKTYSAGASSR